MIKNYKKIKINGNDKTFNGFPYHLNYQQGFSNSASEISMSFISEDGTYTEPVLSTKTPYQIEIGDSGKYKFYLIDYNIEESANGNILNVKFRDDSFILDKKFVGLHKRHGDVGSGRRWNVSTDKEKSIIIVGQEFHPCDTNKDGFWNYIGLTGSISGGQNLTGEDINTFTKTVQSGITGHNLNTDIISTDGFDAFSGVSGISGKINDIPILPGDNLALIDPCDPCPNAPFNKYWDECNKRSNIDVHEVGYNFGCLYSGMSGAGIQIATVLPKYNPFYFAEYVGSLRDVLKNWCADYGWDFYWETGKLHFYDITKPITINSGMIDMTKVIRRTHGKSLEGTENRGSISYYERQGEEKEYRCEGTVKLGLNAAILFDVYGKKAGYYPNDNYMNTQYLEDSCSFAYYSEHLRDAYWWFMRYGIIDSTAAINFVNSGELVNNDGTTGHTSTNYGITTGVMHPLGDMKICKVITQDSGQFVTIGNNVPSTYWNACKSLITDTDLPSFLGKGGYFVVAQYDEKKVTDIQNFEKQMSRWMGHYYYKNFTPIMNRANPSFEFPSNSAKYYPAGTSIETMQMFNVPFDEGTIFDKYTKGPAENPNTKTKRGFVVLEKEAQWIPKGLSYFNSGMSTGYYKLMERMFSVIDQGRSDVLQSVYPESKNNSNIKLLVAYPLTGVYFVREEDFNEVDLKLQNIYTNDGYVYGLTSENCVKYTVAFGYSGQYGTTGAFSFKCPAGSHMLDWEYLQRPGRAEVLQRWNDSFTTLIPRVQTVLQDYENTGEALAFGINYRKIADADLRIITGSNAILNSGATCMPNSGLISGAHALFNSGITFSNTTPTEKLTVEIGGIGEIPTPTVKDGLVSFNIVYQENGVTTVYEFANRQKQLPSLNLMMRNVEMKARIKNSR